MIVKGVIITTVIATLFLASQSAFAASHSHDDELEFAGTLEETLGHFWALEMNLDENNAELALVHATHPIAELYDTMSSHLEDNPDFDARLQKTLMELQHRASTDVSREDAQLAIDEAKDVIEEARMIVVGEELSNDPTFKMQLINGLLETAKVEYREAVADGIIEEMAEFQDGSAFIWRSQQIFDTVSEGLDPIDSDRISQLYSEVWNNFDQRTDPSDVSDRIDAVIYEFVEVTGIESKTSEHAEEVFGDLPPLKQIKAGISPEDVTCRGDLELVFKPSGQPACVKPATAQKLVSMGWTQ